MKTIRIIIYAWLAWFQTNQVNAETAALEFIKTAILTAESNAAFNLNGQALAAAYIPLRTLDLPWANTLDAGAGALIGAGKPEGLVSGRINLLGIANGIFGTTWFTQHSHGPMLPELFIGPAVKMEWPVKRWTWRQDAYFLVGIPFNSILK